MSAVRRLGEIILWNIFINNFFHKSKDAGGSAQLS